MRLGLAAFALDQAPVLVGRSGQKQKETDLPLSPELRKTVIRGISYLPPLPNRTIVLPVSRLSLVADRPSDLDAQPYPGVIQQFALFAAWQTWGKAHGQIPFATRQPVTWGRIVHEHFPHWRQPRYRLLAGRCCASV